MLQREIVRFRASDVQPNPLEVDYWIDVTSNYYVGDARVVVLDTIVMILIHGRCQI